MKRKTDGRKPTYFSAERFYRANDQWYFLMRGGKVFGPFETRELAEAELACYLEMMQPPEADQ